jgi:ADP-heptose:LPS heptosyltransferase
MKTLFGLHGGLGNSIFCLPAIKSLHRNGDDVSLCVQGDYEMVELWRRCVYVQEVFGPSQDLPAFDLYLCGQYLPSSMHGRDVRYCGFPKGTTKYERPEWEQIMRRAECRSIFPDVVDWIRDHGEGQSFDFLWDIGIVPGCKPGDEWSRKTWPGMSSIASVFREQDLSVAAFGLREDFEKVPALLKYHVGPYPLERMPEHLRRCRVIVGTDSGIVHLASSLGVPCVVIYTATSPIKGDPVGDPATIRKISLNIPCSPCQSTPRWKECTNWICRQIPVADVVSAAYDLLSKRKG